MWLFDRCTVRRAAASSAILARVLRALRSRCRFLLNMGFPSVLFLLGFLDHDLLGGIPHALALVGLGAAVGAHFGRHLANLLPVHALDHDSGLRRRLHLDALRHGMRHGAGETEREVELLALWLRAVAHADQR